MTTPMTDVTAPAVSDSDAGSTPRERLGVAFFVTIAVLATASWIALLGWGVIKLVHAF